MAHLSLKPAICRVAISCWLEYLFAEVEGVSSERIEPKPEKRNLTTKVNRMSDARMNMPGLLALLEDEEVNLVGRRETRFSSVPLTGVQLEVFMAFIGCCF